MKGHWKIIPIAIIIISSLSNIGTIDALDSNFSYSNAVTAGVAIDGKFISGMNRPSFNDNNVVAFKGTFSGGSGIFTQNNLIVEVGDIIGGKTLTNVGSPTINDNGDIVFYGGFVGGSGIFTTTSLVAGTADTIDGKFLNSVSNPIINDNGNIFFAAVFTGGNGIFSETALIVEDGNVIDGKTLTNGGFTFSVNDNGNIAFRSSFVGGEGIFTETNLLVEEGDVIDGKTITSFTNGIPQINNGGQVGFMANFDDGAVGSGLFTQNLLLVEDGDIIDGLTSTGPLDDPAWNDIGNMAYIDFSFPPTAIGIFLVKNLPIIPEGSPVSATVGGIVDDGQSNASILIPQGTLPGDTSFTIDVLGSCPAAPPGTFSFGSVCVDFNPDGTIFTAPGASLTIPLNPSLTPGSIIDLFKFNPGSGMFEDTGLDGIVDPSGTTATAQGVTSLSTYAYASSGPVGGTSIPIDTTSLLLAGAFINTWMIPVLVSAVGFGLLFTTRKS